MSPALACGFFTTGTAGKPSDPYSKTQIQSLHTLPDFHMLVRNDSTAKLPIFFLSFFFFAPNFLKQKAEKSNGASQVNIL